MTAVSGKRPARRSRTGGADMAFGGFSQDDLAYEAGVSRSYLSQLEKGVFHASLKVVGKLAVTLQVEPAELLRLPSRRARRS